VAGLQDRSIDVRMTLSAGRWTMPLAAKGADVDHAGIHLNKEDSAAAWSSIQAQQKTAGFSLQAGNSNRIP